MCSESLDIAGFDSIISIRICQYSFTIVTHLNKPDDDKTNGKLASKWKKRYSHFAKTPIRTKPEKGNTAEQKKNNFYTAQDGTESLSKRLIDRGDYE